MKDDGEGGGEDGDEGGGEVSDEGDFKVFVGFCFQTDGRTTGQTDICLCRVNSVSENYAYEANIQNPLKLLT